MANGFVYFVSAYHMNPCGYFKVGVTCLDSYKPRICQLQSASPMHLMVVCIVTDSNPYRLENLFLEEFRRYRIRGEWLSVSENPKQGLYELSHEIETAGRSFLCSSCDGEIIK